mmetsp:Transcript_22568/g.51663  ORF Transcript_22568/g.51663 Transcript_22568/m.51663 type:complete len:125 (+) Transcript_22568:63-437(+)
MAAGPTTLRRVCTLHRLGWRQTRQFSVRPKGMTDKQIEEIRKYDPFLAEQMQTAQAQGINAADWRSLESIPVARQRPQGREVLTGEDQLRLGGHTSSTAREDDEVSKLFKSAKDSVSKFFGWKK